MKYLNKSLACVIFMNTSIAFNSRQPGQTEVCLWLNCESVCLPAIGLSVVLSAVGTTSGSGPAAGVQCKRQSCPRPVVPLIPRPALGLSQSLLRVLSRPGEGRSGEFHQLSPSTLLGLFEGNFGAELDHCFKVFASCYLARSSSCLEQMFWE